ncbi:hypothetical protein VSDG_01370 [Cytospora chrysosperma]|uniref:Enoyl reductase (ER) domain-containing protein n=1 Tax=Cytospora chrysosperma TaxID=252740 RepID=A0A423WIR5_CYTCH|nr:hypothetical protein VSDG_01370 [Valsa sordida]
MESRALVSRGPFSQGGWRVEDVKVREPKDDEVVIEIVASGICHTDLHCGDTPDNKGVPAVFYPRVLGHEGRQVGKAVTSVKLGDPVLLSFSYCGECHVCRTGPPSHCTSFFEINFMGEPCFVDQQGGSIGGRFFGQSSFARHTIVSDKSVVNVSGLGLERDDLKLLAPLGCGLQTGSGTVISAAKAGADDAVAVVGMGGVGLAAVMAAKNQKCKVIIGIDRVEARLELARSLGATHVFNTSDMSMEQLVAAVRDAAEGLGATISIDTSAHPPLVAAQVEYTRFMGKIIQVGTGMPDANLTLHMQSFMASGKQYFGAVQGHCKTNEYIPQMIKWWKQGIFPVEKLVKFFDIEDFEEAVRVMGRGDIVKPIMVW